MSFFFFSSYLKQSLAKPVLVKIKVLKCIDIYIMANELQYRNVKQGLI